MIHDGWVKATYDTSLPLGKIVRQGTGFRWNSDERTKVRPQANLLAEALEMVVGPEDPRGDRASENSVGGGSVCFEALIWLAPLLRQVGDIDSAVQLSQVATQIRPDEASGHSVYGLCLMSQGNLELANLRMNRR